MPELLEAMRAGDRAAAADFMDRFGPRIKARIRVGLSRGMRRVFDSQDLLSTVSRRLDAMVRSGSLRAANEQQLWSLVFTIAEHSLAEKGRIIRRLKRVEGPDSEFAHR
ncbi:MAG TPA: hypothetical protein VG797_02185, partial [Phycisphaerales bacterium]|nr:hypothetical protein [Phycisphaerales bacterium]